MANATQTRATGATLDAILRLWANFGEARAKRAVYNQTVRELSALSNRELDDLGIPRSNIVSIARETAYGPAKTEHRQRW